MRTLAWGWILVYSVMVNLGFASAVGRVGFEFGVQMWEVCFRVWRPYEHSNG